MKKLYDYGTGRRKTAIARVFMKKGTGNMTVNGKAIEAYFGGLKTAAMMVRRPLELLECATQFDLKITVKGGGLIGQAGAVRHGITRALMAYDEDGMPAAVAVQAREGDEVEAAEDAPVGILSWRRRLRAEGLVTRDSREVERKKVGHRKARKVEQYSKR